MLFIPHRRAFTCRYRGSCFRSGRVFFRSCLGIVVFMLSVHGVIYTVLMNPLQNNNDPNTNTDESWLVSECNVFKPNSSDNLIIGSQTPCSSFSHEREKPSLKLFVVVHSTPKETASRDNVRRLLELLLEESALLGIKLQINKAFMLGLSPSSLKSRGVSAAIRQEQEKYGDLVVGHYIDSHRNLTIKMMFGMSYVFYYCPMADFILKLDDDFYFNPIQLAKLIGNAPLQKLWYGMTSSNRIPRRSANNRFFLSYTRYPYLTYPRYTFGGAILFSQDSVSHIISTHKHVPCLPFEDVFIGLCMNGYTSPKWMGLWIRADVMSGPLSECQLSGTIFVESRKYQKYYIENKFYKKNALCFGFLSHWL